MSSKKDDLWLRPVVFFLSFYFDWMDERKNSLIFIVVENIKKKTRERAFFYLTLPLHLRRGNQIEYIEMRKRERRKKRERWMPVVLLPLPRWDETNEWMNKWMKRTQYLLIVNETDVSHIIIKPIARLRHEKRTKVRIRFSISEIEEIVYWQTISSYVYLRLRRKNN